MSALLPRSCKSESELDAGPDLVADSPDPKRAALSINVDNPLPQLPPGASSPSDNPALLDVTSVFSEFSTPSDRIVLLMVGLPARGKTFVARKVQRYFSFFHAVPVRIFNVGEYRRKMYGSHQPAEWFDPLNESGKAARKSCTDAALDDLVAWLTEANDGRMGILDGTHSTLEKREYALERLAPTGCKCIFLESICSDVEIVQRNIRACKLGTPDYAEIEASVAVADFEKRIHVYESNYETMDAESTQGCERVRSWIKIIDCRQFVMNNIRGYIPSRLVQFLSHLHMQPHSFYFTRHGESEYNQLGKIGGDSGLSPAGDRYAKCLAKFAESTICVDAATGDKVAARLWTSTMRRTRETARYITHYKTSIAYTGDDTGGRLQEWIQLRPRAWSNLDELFAGSCDGMTYLEIEQHYPEEFNRRQRDKLAYRYPRGESYLDMIHRLDAMIMEMERHREPLLVIAHQGILRLLYAYYMGLSREEAPYVSIPLNTVIHLQPQVYSCNEQRHRLCEKITTDGQDEPLPHVDLDPPSH